MAIRMMCMLLLGISHASWACETPTLDDLASVLDLPSESMLEARKQAHAELRCLTRPIDSDTAAALHRIEALSHVVDDNYSLALQALTAVQSLDTDWKFPARFEEGPTWALHEEALASPKPASIPLQPVENWTAWVDGAPARARPVDRPLVLQWVGDEVRSTYLPANAAIPPPPVLRERPPSRGLLLGAIGVGSVALGLGGVALGERQAVLGATPPADCPCPDFERTLRGRAKRTNALGVGGAIGGVAALTLGAAWVLR